MIGRPIFKHPGHIDVGDRHVSNSGELLWTCVDWPVYVPSKTGGRTVKITVKLNNGVICPLWFYGHQQLFMEDADPNDIKTAYDRYRPESAY